jgi:SNF2 family DNA or RNA helicase
MATTKQLYPFQAEDVERMRSMGNCINGSEPGVGKTGVAVHLIEGRTLIIVPKSVLYQFRDEITAFRDDVVPLVVTGSPLARRRLYSGQADVLLLTYETLRIDMEAILNLKPFSTLIFDEVHRLGTNTTKTHKAIRRILNHYVKAGYPAPKIFGFTASLIMNSPMDVYGVYNIFRPGLFRNWLFFVEEYMQRSPQGWLVGARQSRLEKLGQLIRPYFLRRTLAEVAPQLPPHVDEIIRFDLSPAETKLYKLIRAELLLEIDLQAIDKVKNPMSLQNALTKLQKLSELTDHPSLLGSSGIPSSKVEVLQEKLKELLTGNTRKCVIFSRFARMMEILEPLLEEYNPVVIQGSVSGDDRLERMAKFKTDSSCRIMLMTTAGSEGISLEEASYLIRLDTPFSIGRDIQLTGRIRRITSVEPTFSFTLVARETVDEKMLKILDRKKNMNSIMFNWEDIKEILYE